MKLCLKLIIALCFVFGALCQWVYVQKVRARVFIRKNGLTFSYSYYYFRNTLICVVPEGRGIVLPKRWGGAGIKIKGRDNFCLQNLIFTNFSDGISIGTGINRILAKKMEINRAISKIQL